MSFAWSEAQIQTRPTPTKFSSCAHISRAHGVRLNFQKKRGLTFRSSRRHRLVYSSTFFESLRKVVRTILDSCSSYPSLKEHISAEILKGERTFILTISNLILFSLSLSFNFFFWLNSLIKIAILIARYMITCRRLLIYVLYLYNRDLFRLRRSRL